MLKARLITTLLRVVGLFKVNSSAVVTCSLDNLLFFRRFFYFATLSYRFGPPSSYAHQPKTRTRCQED